MCPQVLCQRGAVCELLIAMSALVGPFVRVSPEKQRLMIKYSSGSNNRGLPTKKKIRLPHIKCPQPIRKKSQ